MGILARSIVTLIDAVQVFSWRYFNCMFVKLRWPEGLRFLTARIDRLILQHTIWREYAIERLINILEVAETVWPLETRSAPLRLPRKFDCYMHVRLRAQRFLRWTFANAFDRFANALTGTVFAADQDLRERDSRCPPEIDLRFRCHGSPRCSVFLWHHARALVRAGYNLVTSTTSSDIIFTIDT